MRNRQEAFDIAVAGLAAQDWEQALDPDGHCVYRGENSTCCAIGHMISDEDYTPDWEHMSPAYSPDFGNEANVEIAKATGLRLTNANVEWMKSLQRAHDNNIYPKAMVRGLATFADYWGMKIPTELSEAMEKYNVTV